MPNPYVNSRFPRIPDDYYPTIDPRCVYGFLEHFTPRAGAVDPCAPNGSGIVNTLIECGIDAAGHGDAFAPGICAEWIVSNPPYDRKIKIRLPNQDPADTTPQKRFPLVDAIIYRQIDRIRFGEVESVAMLLRNNFAFAKTRKPMFRENRYYCGEIKLMFRPWWSEDRDKQPIHNYVWHIWSVYKGSYFHTPAQWFADGERMSKNGIQQK